MLDRTAIARLIPHQGSMCLIDGVDAWSATSIECWALTHRAAANPLRRDGALGALAGIEYGLQAMAVHGALCDDKPHPPGYLSSLREVELGRRDLDGVAGRLAIRAELLISAAQGFIYRFAVSGDGEMLVAGRASIAFPDGAGEHA
jgi:predicted hotdog family 3-hydroxylacyl-ACP dehydratase